jgi:hypothetical protein
LDTRSTLILAVILILIAHLIEEVKTGFRKQLPVGEMPLPVFIGINAVLYPVCFAILYLSIIDHLWAVPLAWGIGLVMAGNGLGHIGMMVYKKAYFPGGLTAFPLLAVSVWLLVHMYLS